MARIERFEEIDAWKLAVELAKSIYSITSTGEIARDFSFRDQLRRSAVSISSNIAEGFDRESNLQFIYFLKIAKGSCAELRSQLFVALEINYIMKYDYEKLIEQCVNISKKIGAFVSYLGNKQREKLNIKREN